MTGDSVFGLIFNGLSAGLMPDTFMPLSERLRIARCIYETLQHSGVEVRLVGLERLRSVATGHDSRCEREFITEVNEFTACLCVERLRSS